MGVTRVVHALAGLPIDNASRRGPRIFTTGAIADGQPFLSFLPNVAKKEFSTIPWAATLAPGSGHSLLPTVAIYRVSSRNPSPGSNASLSRPSVLPSSLIKNVALYLSFLPGTVYNAHSPTTRMPSRYAFTAYAYAYKKKKTPFVIPLRRS